MTESKWKYIAWHGDGGEVGFTINDAVLKIYIAQINAQEYNVPVEVAEDRARLLAAAPELLTACEGLIVDMDTIEQDDGIQACQCLSKAPDDITEPRPCFYCQAKAAIKAAKKGGE